MVFRLFVLLIVVTTGSIIAVAEQDGTNQEQPVMTFAPPPIGFAVNGSTVTRESPNTITYFHLNRYEAVAGDLSLCAGEKNCLKEVESIQSWLCAFDACDGIHSSKYPTSCFQSYLKKYSIEAKERIFVSICSWIKSPSTETRKALLNDLSDVSVSEDGLVEHLADLLALKRSALSCEDTIKNYVGAYGPKWNYKWYRALSGCRILARETTREQEEKDFYIWFGVVHGSGNCSDISIGEMRDACSAPGAASPLPTQL